MKQIDQTKEGRIAYLEYDIQRLERVIPGLEKQLNLVKDKLEWHKSELKKLKEEPKVEGT